MSAFDPTIGKDIWKPLLKIQFTDMSVLCWKVAHICRPVNVRAGKTHAARTRTTTRLTINLCVPVDTDFKPANTIISLARAVVFGSNFYLQTFPHVCPFELSNYLLQWVNIVLYVWWDLWWWWWGGRGCKFKGEAMFGSWHAKLCELLYITGCSSVRFTAELIFCVVD